MQKSVTEVLERLQSVQTEDELRGIIEDYLSKTDISTYAYIAFMPTDGPRGINNHPDRWLEHYAKNGYLDLDPVISRARTQVLPVQWQDVNRDLHRREKQVLDEGSEVGIISGATVPLSGPGQNSGMFFFASDISNQKFDRQWQDLKYDLHLVGLYFHSAFIDLAKPHDLSACHLTLRERECLTWAARGKSAWDISEILSVSERTVGFHLQNAYKKLGCNNRHVAVIRAMMAGLIQL